MRCQRAQQRLMAYHDSELSPGARRRVEKHLETCGECSQLLERLRLADRHASHSKGVNDMVGVPEMPPPEDKYWEGFTARVLDRVEEDAATRAPERKKPRRSWDLFIPRMVPAFSMALVVVVAAGVLMKMGNQVPIPKVPEDQKESARQGSVLVAEKEAPPEKYDGDTKVADTRRSAFERSLPRDDAYRPAPSSALVTKPVPEPLPDPKPAAIAQRSQSDLSPIALATDEADQAKAEKAQEEADRQALAKTDAGREAAVKIGSESEAPAKLVAEPEAQAKAEADSAREAALSVREKIAQAEAEVYGERAARTEKKVDLPVVDNIRESVAKDVPPSPTIPDAGDTRAASKPDIKAEGVVTDTAGQKQPETTVSQAESMAFLKESVQDTPGRTSAPDRGAVPTVLAAPESTPMPEPSTTESTAPREASDAVSEMAASVAANDLLNTDVSGAASSLVTDGNQPTPEPFSVRKKVAEASIAEETVEKVEESPPATESVTSARVSRRSGSSFGSMPYRGPEDQLVHAKSLAEVRKFWESEQVLKDLLSQKPPQPVQEEASILLVKVLSSQNRLGEAQQILDDAKGQFPANDMIQTYELNQEGKD